MEAHDKSQYNKRRVVHVSLRNMNQQSIMLGRGGGIPSISLINIERSLFGVFIGALKF